MTLSASRRSFLRGRLTELQKLPIRPPWALVESDFITACTKCGECGPVCTESIIVTGDGGYPEVDFAKGECTFCGNCAIICGPGALKREAGLAPWSLRARIDRDTCLSARGVTCRACGENCDARAITFTPGLRGTATLHLDQGACTGCGACVRPCPVDAIEVQASPSTVTVEQRAS